MTKYLFLLFIGLQACGQTGPLYMPEPEPITPIEKVEKQES